MKKLPVILLLTVSLLLAACDSADADGANDLSDETTPAATTTVGGDETSAPEDDVTAAPEGEVTDEPSGETTSAPDSSDEPTEPEANEAFADLMKKFPIVSAPTSSFAASSSEEMIGNAVEKMEKLEDGAVQVKASISTDMGMFGSRDEEFVMTLMKLGDAYQSTTESTSTVDGERYTTLERYTYLDGCYYYLYEDASDDSFNEKYKITLTREDFDEFVLGITDEAVEGVDDFDFSQFADMIKNALEQTSGMTEEGGCSYFSRGIKADAIEDFSFIEDLGEEMGDYLTEDCLSKIATVITLDKDGDLKGIYFDLPLEISVEEGDFSMTMALSMQFEITVRKTTADDKIEAPADADSYEEKSIDDLLDLDSWFDEDWFDEEPIEDGENKPVDDADATL